MLKPPSILKKDSSLVCSDIQNNCNLGKPYIPEHKHLVLVNLITSLNGLAGFILIRVILSTWNKTLVSGRAIIVSSYEIPLEAGNIFERKLVFVLGVHHLFEFVDGCEYSVYIYGRRSCLGYFLPDSLVSFVLFCLHL